MSTWKPVPGNNPLFVPDGVAVRGIFWATRGTRREDCDEHPAGHPILLDASIDWSYSDDSTPDTAEITYADGYTVGRLEGLALSTRWYALLWLGVSLVWLISDWASSADWIEYAAHGLMAPAAVYMAVRSHLDLRKARKARP